MPASSLHRPARARRQAVGSYLISARGLSTLVLVPVAVERLRSGNGAHAWLFFAAPVAAAAARRVGSFLITETMTRRHVLSMESYDRLFPNQDTSPRVGFGNLIALPLQRSRRNPGEYGLPGIGSRTSSRPVVGPRRHPALESRRDGNSVGRGLKEVSRGRRSAR